MIFFNKFRKLRFFKIYLILVSAAFIFIIFVFQRCYNKNKTDTPLKVNINREIASGNNDDYDPKNNIDKYSFQINRKSETIKEALNNDLDTINDNVKEELIKIKEGRIEYDKKNEDTNKSIYVNDISISSSDEVKIPKSGIKLQKDKKIKENKIFKTIDYKLKNKDTEPTNFSIIPCLPVLNNSENISIENYNTQIQRNEEETINNNENLVNVLTPPENDNQRQHILINDYLESEWKEKETNKLRNCFLSYFCTSKSEICKKLNPKDKRYKNIFSEFDSDLNLENNKISVFVKNIKKDLLSSLQIAKSVSKKLFLNLDSYDILIKNVDLCKNLIQYSKTIATTIKIIDFAFWYEEQLADAVDWANMALEISHDLEIIQNEIISLEEDRNLNTENSEIHTEQIPDYINDIRSSLFRIKQLYNQTEAFIIFMGGREINNLSEDNQRVNRSKQELQIRMMDINQITNFAMIEFIIVKYISSGMLKFQNLDQEKKIELLSNFQKIKEINQKINQFREDALQVYGLNKIHRRSISDILQRTISI